MTLWMTIGIPGSGKSTLSDAWAKHYGCPEAVVSTDAYRVLLTGTKNNQDENLAVFEIVQRIIRGRLRNGLDVWVDATNLNWNDEHGAVSYAEYAKARGHMIMSVVMDAPFEECVRRNEARETPVPHDVMLKMKARLDGMRRDDMPGHLVMASTIWSAIGGYGS